MPTKDMKQFLHEFFNPPKFSKPTETRRRTGKKKVKKRTGPSPIETQLAEAAEFMKYKLEEFDACTTEGERLDLVYRTIPDEATTIDRLWPNQLLNKDSRIRREFTNLGIEHLLAREFEKTLEKYNQAVLYSSGKGLGHTLARRGAFLLQTRDHSLALRDIILALDYGCLENELLDFLLDHHVIGIPNDILVGSKLELKYNRSIVRRPEIPVVYRIRSVLTVLGELTRVNSVEAKAERNLRLDEILAYIRDAQETMDFSRNVETKEVNIPLIAQTNPDYPAFSASANVQYNQDKGRYVVAEAEILAGDLIGVEGGISTMLYPERNQNNVNHCQHCYTFTKAPIPCEVCCSVVYCSLYCRDSANSSYHQYECEMRMYEIITAESTEMSAYFLALRTVTLENLQFFIDRSDAFAMFFDQLEPTFPLVGLQGDAVRHTHMMNLVTHMCNIPEEKSMKAAVISVYLLRCLQHAKYFKHHVPQKRKGDRLLHKHELLMLRILHHLVLVQLHNCMPINKLITEPGKYAWERLGVSLNTSLALLNHDCDPNAFIFHIGKKVLLLALRHIRAGEEIRISYIPTYLTLERSQREYRLLKHYEFLCECAACLENWKLKEEIPDLLARIPNFEQERCFVVRHGDKKDICDEINAARWMADFGITTESFEVAQEALNTLSRSLSTHVRKPHLHFVEAAELVEKLIIGKFVGFTMAELDQIKEEVQVKATKEAPKKEATTKRKSETATACATVNKETENMSETEAFIADLAIPMEIVEESLPEEPAGTSKLIKAFQEPKTASPVLNARAKSPTLRLFAAGEPGKNKKSVLDRFDDSVLNNSKDQTSYEVKKAKLDLAESFRKVPAKQEMLDRMAAFQTKEKQAVTKKRSLHKKTHSAPRKADKKEKVEVTEETNLIDESANLEQRDIEKEVELMIAAKREERRAAKKQKLAETISAERKSLLEKDDMIQKKIFFKEEKLQSLKDRSDKKDCQLTEKEIELKKIREKAKLMMLRAQEKEKDFKVAEKEFKSVLDSDKQKNSMMNKILAKVNEKASAMKEEMRMKRMKEDEDNLLSFLRKAHKKGGDIYCYINNPDCSTNAVNIDDKTSPPDDQNVMDEKSEHLLSNVGLSEHLLHPSRSNTDMAEAKSSFEGTNCSGKFTQNLNKNILQSSPPANIKDLKRNRIPEKPPVSKRTDSKISKNGQTKKATLTKKPPPHSPPTRKKEMDPIGLKESIRNIQNKSSLNINNQKSPKSSQKDNFGTLEMKDTLLNNGNLDPNIRLKLSQKMNDVNPKLTLSTAKSPKLDSKSNKEKTMPSLLNDSSSNCVQSSSTNGDIDNHDVRSLEHNCSDSSSSNSPNLARNASAESNLSVTSIVLQSPKIFKHTTEESSPQLQKRLMKDFSSEEYLHHPPAYERFHSTDSTSADQPNLLDIISSKIYKRSISASSCETMFSAHSSLENIDGVRMNEDYIPEMEEVLMMKSNVLRPSENFLMDRQISTESAYEDTVEASVLWEEDKHKNSLGSPALHYSQRWSVSPGKEIFERKGRTKLRGQVCLRGKRSVREPTPSSGEEDHQVYGKLNRRKSLSDNCLLLKTRQPRKSSKSRESTERELDAFGIPRLPRQKRSVSLMRENFAKGPQRSEERPRNIERERSISRETRTSSAAEVKSLFETGGVKNSCRGSRATTPCKPVQVDPQQLTKIKTKFEEVKTENLMLPFPNYKKRPPPPRWKPPPPPSLF